jgi:hypothetical protein
MRHTPVSANQRHKSTVIVLFLGLVSLLSPGHSLASEPYPPEPEQPGTLTEFCSLFDSSCLWVMRDYHKRRRAWRNEKTRIDIINYQERVEQDGAFMVVLQDVFDPIGLERPGRPHGGLINYIPPKGAAGVRVGEPQVSRPGVLLPRVSVPAQYETSPLSGGDSYRETGLKYVAQRGKNGNLIISREDFDATKPTLVLVSGSTNSLAEDPGGAMTMLEGAHAEGAQATLVLNPTRFGPWPRLMGLPVLRAETKDLGPLLRMLSKNAGESPDVTSWTLSLKPGSGIAGAWGPREVTSDALEALSRMPNARGIAGFSQGNAIAQELGHATGLRVFCINPSVSTNTFEEAPPGTFWIQNYFDITNLTVPFGAQSGAPASGRTIRYLSVPIPFTNIGRGESHAPRVGVRIVSHLYDVLPDP